MEPERVDPNHEIVGERPPLEPEDFARSVREHFERGVEGMESLTPASHEVVVKIGDQVVPARELKVTLKKTGETIIKYKDVIIFVSAAGLSAAGLFLTARDHLRTRRKK